MRTIFSILILLLALTSASSALSFEQAVAKIEGARAGVKKLDADAVLRFDLIVGFLPYSESLSGRYHYEHPDQHRFDFPDAPSYLQSLPSLLNWKLPAAEKYSGKLKGPYKIEGRDVYQLYYLPKNPDSKVRSITINVDPDSWTFVRHFTDYRDGGTLELDFTHSKRKGHHLLDLVKAKLNLPSFKLKGTAAIELSNHKFN